MTKIDGYTPSEWVADDSLTLRIDGDVYIKYKEREDGELVPAWPASDWSDAAIETRE